MSDQTEHNSEEAKETEENVENAEIRSNDGSKNETSMLRNITDLGLLEDVEMPTYISVGSLRSENPGVSNSKIEDRTPIEEEERSTSPYRSDDQGRASVYVLSSGEDGDPNMYDDEEDDYGDSEDMDEMDEQEEAELHHSRVLDEDEEEDIDEDDRPEYYDRVSDDFVINNRLKRNCKERSLSLQDLSIHKDNIHAARVKKRQSCGLPQNSTTYSMQRGRRSMPVNYHHVQSKVKQYIINIKKQNRRSRDTLIARQHRECSPMENHTEAENNDEAEVKPMGKKTIKNYVANAIKDLQCREDNEEARAVYGMVRILENGDKKNDAKSAAAKHVQASKELHRNIVENEKNLETCEDKVEKRNGSVDVNTNHIEYQATADRNVRFNIINQLNVLRDAYQKSLAENVKIKEELEALKKSLAKSESKSRDKKREKSVQTEIQERKSESSIDPFAESACSLTFSMETPNVTAALNSDDSSVPAKPPTIQVPRPLSKTFVTSSRILQTLSSITKGKSCLESSPLAGRNSRKRRNESLVDLEVDDCASPIRAASFKKPRVSERNALEEEETKLPQDACKPLESRSESPTRCEKDEAIEEKKDLVKCFVYREDENSKNQSFLIQTEEPTKESFLNSRRGRIQECGPYLLGNLEVRMSEINGTISVWGKEVTGQETDEDDEATNKLPVGRSEATNKLCQSWQKTPETKFNPTICSTNERTNKLLPRYPRSPGISNLSQCWNSSVDQGRASCSIEPPDDATSHQADLSSCCHNLHLCENCDSSKSRRDWSACKSLQDSRDKSHSSCAHRVDHSSREECVCPAHRERQRREEAQGNTSKEHKSSPNGLRKCRTEAANKYFQENLTSNSTDEIIEVLLENAMDNCQGESVCCNTVKDISYMCKSSSANTNSQACNHSSSHEGDENPLIAVKRSNETSKQLRHRRVSGKRVRGILMDLLGRCGTCYANCAHTAPRNNHREKEVPYSSNTSQIKASLRSAPEPSSSSSTRAQCGAERYYQADVPRIETQLEEFRIELERLRSRMDGTTEKFGAHHSADMN